MLIIKSVCFLVDCLKQQLYRRNIGIVRNDLNKGTENISITYKL